ncbi:MAG: NUDIX domain-containing protein [Candidatus Kerfeldbacteria bacterium]|nr:NUDIX domain-containing protein [Candidatus Kerfeldbacteria bacterium]
MKDFYHVSLKLFLKNASGQTLILAAGTTGSYAGYFDVPGGRVDDSEFTTPLIEIVKRELREECGLTDVTIRPNPVAYGRHLVPGRQEQLDHDVHVLYLFFEGTLHSGQVKLSHEHTSFQWIDLETLDLEQYFTSGILEGVRMYLGNPSVHRRPRLT